MTMTTATNYDVARAATASAASADVRPDPSGTATSALLPEPVAIGLCNGSIAELAMLLTKADEQDRTASRQIEDAADQAASREASDRVTQMRAKASADECEAFAGGIADMAAGACSIGAMAFTPTAGEAHRFGVGDALKAGGLAVKESGQLMAGMYKGDSGRAEAEAARFEALTQADNRRYDRAQGDAQAANESIQRIEQFLDQIQQTQNATRLAAATYRG